MRGKKLSIGLRAILAMFAVTLSATSTWAAIHEKVLHNFNNNGKDGNSPFAGLIFDASGNLYGTTDTGGIGYGTVFELTSTTGGRWTEKVLHSFNNDGVDGTYPYFGSLIFDGSGNLYGTTNAGGTTGVGTVFELTPAGGGSWTETVLYDFGNTSTDGYQPLDDLIFDASGNLYGTTSGGGTYGYGTVFELTPTTSGTWSETVLHSFNHDGTDGYYPLAGLIFDTAGNLYGTTYYGSANSNGTVFELTPATGGGWTETVLHGFAGTDGGSPEAGLIFDASGNLYGTTRYGGAKGSGTVFELTRTAGVWREKVVHNFNGTDGNQPIASLIFDASGNLYGTASGGGLYGYGTAFKLTPNTGGRWTEKALVNFDGTDGLSPYTNLILDGSGDLYGTTGSGGAFGSYGYGVVFEITP
jgi:uncharacterized repeat protein (TIGR03803 family)